MEIMTEGDGSFEWDFLKLVALWNLYALPVLLGLVVARAFIRTRSTHDGSRSDAIATVRQIGMIHYVMGARALIQLAQELITLRAMGIPQSNPITGFIFPGLSVLVNPLLGRGLRRLHRGSRRWAIVWYVLWSFFAVWAAYWMWHYRAAVVLSDWPDHVAGKAMPILLLFIMALPRTRRAFREQKATTTTPEPGTSNGGVAQAGVRADADGGLLVSLLVLLLLVVACSTLVVDAADWIQRLVFEPRDDATV
jgi:hypothetical protein